MSRRAALAVSTALVAYGAVAVLTVVAFERRRPHVPEPDPRIVYLRTVVVPHLTREMQRAGVELERMGDVLAAMRMN